MCNDVKTYHVYRLYLTRMGASTLTSNTNGLLRKTSRTARVVMSSVTKFSRQCLVMYSSSSSLLKKTRLSSESLAADESREVFVRLDVIDRNDAGVLRSGSPIS